MIQRPDCACGEREAAGDPRAPPAERRAGCDGLPKVAGVCENPPSKLGAMVFFGNIPRPFHLLALPRPNPPRVLCTVPGPAVHSPAFERIDIAECAGVGKVELDNVVAVVEWCAWVWPQGRILTEGHEPTARRGIYVRSGQGRRARSDGMARGGWEKAFSVRLGVGVNAVPPRA